MILDRDEVPEERQVAKLLKQILDGIAFLHSLNVAHLDIKVSLESCPICFQKHFHSTVRNVPNFFQSNFLTTGLYEKLLK